MKIIQNWQKILFLCVKYVIVLQSLFYLKGSGAKTGMCHLRVHGKTFGTTVALRSATVAPTAPSVLYFKRGTLVVPRSSNRLTKKKMQLFR